MPLVSCHIGKDQFGLERQRGRCASAVRSRSVGHAGLGQWKSCTGGSQAPLLQLQPTWDCSWPARKAAQSRGGTGSRQDWYGALHGNAKCSVYLGQVLF